MTWCVGHATEPHEFAQFIVRAVDADQAVDLAWDYADWHPVQQDELAGELIEAEPPPHDDAGVVEPDRPDRATWLRRIGWYDPEVAAWCDGCGLAVFVVLEDSHLDSSGRCASCRSER